MSADFFARLARFAAIPVQQQLESNSADFCVNFAINLCRWMKTGCFILTTKSILNWKK